MLVVTYWLLLVYYPTPYLGVALSVYFSNIRLNHFGENLLSPMVGYNVRAVEWDLF